MLLNWVQRNTRKIALHILQQINAAIKLGITQLKAVCPEPTGAVAVAGKLLLLCLTWWIAPVTSQKAGDTVTHSSNTQPLQTLLPQQTNSGEM